MFRCSPFTRGPKFRCNPTDHKYVVITTDHRVQCTTNDLAFPSPHSLRLAGRPPFVVSSPPAATVADLLRATTINHGGGWGGGTKNKETILRLAGQTPSLSCLHRPQQSPLSSVQRPPTTVAGGKEEQKTKKQYQPLNYDKVLLLIRFISSNDSVSFKSYCDAHTEYLG